MIAPTERSIKTVTIVLSFSCQIAAVLLFSLQFNELGLPGLWRIQAYILYLISGGFSVAFFIYRTTYLKFLFLLIRVILLLVFLIPVNYAMDFTFFSLLCIVIELGSIISLVKTLVISFLILVLVYIEPGGVQVWHNVKAVSDLSSDILNFIFSMIIFTLTGLLRSLYSKLIDSDQILNSTRETSRKLSRVNLEFQEYASKIDNKASYNERNRITSEIHDDIGYAMTNIAIMMEAAEDQVRLENEEHLLEFIRNTKDLSRDTLEKTRRTLRLLRNDKIQITPALNAIARVAKNFENVLKVNVDIEYGNAPKSFGVEIDSILIRIIQEAFTNAIHHGEATEIKIIFWIDNTDLNLTIHDNGVGSEEIKEGIGLKSMKERLGLFNGSVTAKKVIDGFDLIIKIPKSAIRGLEL